MPPAPPLYRVCPLLGKRGTMSSISICRVSSLSASIVFVIMRKSQRVRIRSVAVTGAPGFDTVSERDSWRVWRAWPLCPAVVCRQRIRPSKEASTLSFSLFFFSFFLPLPPLPLLLSFLPSFLLFFSFFAALMKDGKIVCHYFGLGLLLFSCKSLSTVWLQEVRRRRYTLRDRLGWKWLRSLRPGLLSSKNRRLKYIYVPLYWIWTLSQEVSGSTFLDNLLFLPLQRSSFSKILLFSNSKFLLRYYTAHHWNRKEASSICKEVAF